MFKDNFYVSAFVNCEGCIAISNRWESNCLIAMSFVLVANPPFLEGITFFESLAGPAIAALIAISILYGSSHKKMRLLSVC